MAIYAVLFFPFRIFRMSSGIRHIPSAITSSILSFVMILLTANVSDHRVLHLGATTNHFTAAVHRLVRNSHPPRIQSQN